MWGLALLGFGPSVGDVQRQPPCDRLTCSSEHPDAPGVVLWLGHSIVNGNGSDARWSGLPVPCRYRHAGTDYTAWLDAPSVPPYLVARMARPCTIVVRAAGGAEIGAVVNTHWPAAQADLAALGATPDHVYLWIGENDAADSGEHAAFVAALEPLLDSIETTYPSAHIYLIETVPSETAFPGTYLDEIRAEQVAAQAREPATRTLVLTRSPSVVPLQADNVHLRPHVNGGNDVVAQRIMEVW